MSREKLKSIHIKLLELKNTLTISIYPSHDYWLGFHKNY